MSPVGSAGDRESKPIEATKNTEGAHDEHVRDAATHRAAREATNLLTATPDEAAILIDAWWPMRCVSQWRPARGPRATQLCAAAARSDP
jgi:hypothetical protein